MSRSALCIATLAAVWVAAMGEGMADTGELKDPMRPFQPDVAQPAAVEQRFRLSATLVSGARQVAVINGRPTRVGHAVDGALVIAVEPSSVELRLGSRTFTILLSRGRAQDE